MYDIFCIKYAYCIYVYVFWTYLVMNQPNLQMQYLHRKLRIQPVAGNSNFHNMLIHTKIVPNTNTKYQEEKYKLKKNKKYHIFLGDWEQVSKTLPVLPTVKTGRSGRQWQFVLLSISPFCLFPFLLHFVNICLLLYFCQYLSFGSSSPQFHPWGSCQSGLSRSAACFHLYSCPPPTTQIRKIRKHANTQIRRYPNTPKHKNANTVEDGFHAPLFQPTPRLRFCHTNCIYWQYNCSKE